MNFEKFVAKRLHKDKNLKHSISKPILKMAIVAVSLSICVMIIAISTGKGFQNKIANKVTGFTSEIQIKPLDFNQSHESSPITIDSTLLNKLIEIKSIKFIHPEITKNALIKTDYEFDGVLVKGVNHEYNWDFFEEHLIVGKCPNYQLTEKSSEILISKKISNNLDLKLNDETLFYFQGKNKAKAVIRKFKIIGIYETGIELFDDHYVISDIKHIQKINHWNKDQFGSLEIHILEQNKEKSTINMIESLTPLNTKVISIYDRFPQIFDWIRLFDINILLIIIIMILVASINMISSFIIVILERTKMIGLLKSLGATHLSIKKIFLFHAIYILQKGLIIGNGIGLFLIGLQHLFGPIKLDPSHYYVKEVPVLISIENWLFINLLSIFICFVILLIPAQIIKRVMPIQALRYE